MTLVHIRAENFAAFIMLFDQSAITSKKKQFSLTPPESWGKPPNLGILTAGIGPENVHRCAYNCNFLILLHQKKFANRHVSCYWRRATYAGIFT
jgi:hypothetical protein